MPDLSLLQIYSTLLEKFGLQYWWPITRNGELTPVYRKDIHNKPLTDNERFEIAVGAILTQNTSWKNVEKAISNLSKDNLISPEKIIKIKKDKLANIIKSSGYYNQKAERLKIFSGWLTKKYQGSLKKFFSGKNTSSMRNELLSLKGIGPETADSILLYAGNKPSFVIDAYTKRTFGRIGIKEQDYHELQKIFTESLPHDTILFKEYHALIVELGKNYCNSKTICESCPILKFCDYGNAQRK